MSKQKILLGTHDSLSGYECFWLLQPLNRLLAKCQSLNIQEQFDFGVRFTGRGQGIIVERIVEKDNPFLFLFYS